MSYAPRTRTLGRFVRWWLARSARFANACCVLAMVLATPAAAAVTYHVAINGSDDNSGSQAAPFASIEKAQESVRKALKSHPGEPITVVVHPGTFRLKEPLIFTPNDSGTADAPVTYRAAESGEAILSGGMPIEGWKKVGRLWQARIAEVAEGNLYFHQLFVNGRRARLAVTPNEFYLRTAGPIRALGDRMKARRDPETRQGFRFRKGDFGQWDNRDDVFIELYHSWTTSLHWIDQLDLDRRIVRFTNRSGWPVGYWETFERYRVHNYFEALDSPGEWYLDRSSGTLYYWPLAGEDMTTAEVVAPRLTDLVRVEGEPEQGRFVRHLRLVGLSFQHEDWRFDRESTVDGQAHAKQQNAAITAFGLQRSAFERCEVAHVGAHAIRLDEGCQHNRVVQCEIHDCGGGGIYIGPDAKVGYMPPDDDTKVQHNVVENNFIHHTSHLLGGSIGIWVGSSSFNEIRNNEISDFDYTGISVGWCWGRQTDIFQRGNRIEYNHVHHNVGNILSDNGGIYVLGYSPGSVIRGNVIHHIRHYPYINDSRGIYLDGNTSEYLVEKNLVHHIDSFGVTLKGQHNVVRHNIFAFCGDSGFNRLFKAHAKDYEYDQSTLERNIVYQCAGNITSGFYAPRWTKIEKNLYWNTCGPDAVLFNDWSARILKDAPRIEGVRFAKWQELDRDSGSLVADPQFVDAAAADFRLKAQSPATKIDFEPFDHEKAGLLGEPEWTGLPEQIERELLQYAPPPPSPFPLDCDFEQFESGEPPILPGRLIEGAQTSIRVTDRTAADGAKSLAFVDGPEKRSYLPHWAVWFRDRAAGKIILACDVYNDAKQPARFRLEFRDWSADGWHAGPTITIDPSGTVLAGQKSIGVISPGRWAHLEVHFADESSAAKTFAVVLPNAEGQMKTVDGLPMPSGEFAKCTWFGISSLTNEKASFYVDNLRLAIGGAKR